MRCCLVLLGSVVWAGSFPSSSGAQIADNVIEVGDVTFDTQAETVWVNAAQCAASDATNLRVILGSPFGSQQFVFAAGDNVNCEQNDVRNQDPPQCGQVDGSPFQNEIDELISIPLSALTATGFVNCENAALTGEPNTIFQFRDNAPGSQDVGPEGYGIARFTVDVLGPLAVTGLDTTPRTGSTFTLSWNQPDERELLEYRFLQNLVNDPSSATVIEGVTAGEDATTARISGSRLTLNEDDSAFLFVQAVDQAGNPGDLSAGVQVIVVPTEGFCTASGECTGCSAARLSPSRAVSTWGVFGILALLGLVCVRRLVR